MVAVSVFGSPLVASSSSKIEGERGGSDFFGVSSATWESGRCTHGLKVLEKIGEMIYWPQIGVIRLDNDQDGSLVVLSI
ncbi:hypothetical protein Tco_0576221 [Tanacetum coccineum]